MSEFTTHTSEMKPNHGAANQQLAVAPSTVLRKPAQKALQIVSHPADIPSPVNSRMTIYVMVASLVLFVVWASYATVDQVTRAPAQIIAAARTQIIQSPDSGVVTRIHVKEGQVVDKGELLVTLERERAQAAVDDSSAKLAALRAALSRLQAEVYSKPLLFDIDLKRYPELLRNQTDLYNKRRRAYLQDIESLEKILQISQAELQMNIQLLASGDVSKSEILRLQRTVADIQSQITNKSNKYFQDGQAEMTKVQEDLNTQSEQFRDRHQLLEHTELFAPSDGVVNNIRLTTLGAVVRPGEVVLELLPTGGDLIAESKVSPTDVPFIKVGQFANVRLDAYDSSIFGSMRGEVSYISPDVITEETRQGPNTYFRVHILIREAEFKGEKAKQIILRPGLSASVDIKGIDRTVLSYLTKPVTKTLSLSFGER